MTSVVLSTWRAEPAWPAAADTCGTFWGTHRDEKAPSQPVVLLSPRDKGDSSTLSTCEPTLSKPKPFLSLLIAHRYGAVNTICQLSRKFMFVHLRTSLTLLACLLRQRGWWRTITVVLLPSTAIDHLRKEDTNCFRLVSPYYLYNQDPSMAMQKSPHIPHLLLTQTSSSPNSTEHFSSFPTRFMLGPSTALGSHSWKADSIILLLNLLKLVVLSPGQSAIMQVWSGILSEVNYDH